MSVYQTNVHAPKASDTGATLSSYSSARTKQELDKHRIRTRMNSTQVALCADKWMTGAAASRSCREHTAGRSSPEYLNCAGRGRIILQFFHFTFCNLSQQKGNLPSLRGYICERSTLYTVHNVPDDPDAHRMYTHWVGSRYTLYINSALRRNRANLTQLISYKQPPPPPRVSVHIHHEQVSCTAGGGKVIIQYTPPPLPRE